MKLWFLLLILNSFSPKVLLQKLGFAEACTGNLDIVIVLDSSGSIRDNNPQDGAYDNWDLALKFVQNLVGSIGAKQSTNRFGLVFFSNIALNKFFLNTYNDTQEIVDAVGRMADDYLGGDTNTQEGIIYMNKEQFVNRNGDRADVPNLAIIITDGVSTILSNNTIPAAEAARQDGILIASIGVSDRINEEELKAMSSMPQKLDENYFKAADFDALDLILDKVVSSCPVPTTPTPTTTTTATATPITLPTITQDSTTTTTTRRLEACTQNLDIVIVLDSSGSIRDNNPQDGSYDNWDLVVGFVQDLVRSIGASPYTNRFGLVLYSGITLNKFFLNTHSSTQEVVDAVETLKYDYLGGDTNTQEGIIYMHKEQFVSRNGDRADVTNLAIIITDGVSTIMPENTIPAAEEAKQEGIIIISIGVSNRINEDELKAMSSMPQKLGENYFKAADFNALDMVIDTVVSQSCVISTTLAPVPITSGIPVTPKGDTSLDAVLYFFGSMVTCIVILLVAFFTYIMIKKRVIPAEKLLPEEKATSKLQPPKSPIRGYTCNGTKEFPYQYHHENYPSMLDKRYIGENKQKICMNQPGRVKLFNTP